MATRLVLPHPAGPDPSGVVPARSHRYGGGVDRRHAAVARCHADVIQTRSGTKVYIEQTIPGPSNVVNSRVDHARMDLVFHQDGITTYVDVATVTPFSSGPGLVAAASARPGYMAKRAEKIKFDRYPHTNLVPFMPPWIPCQEVHQHLMKDADHPSLAIRDTWSAVQSVFTAPSPNNNSQQQPRDPPPPVPILFSQTRLLLHTLQCSFHLPPHVWPVAPHRSGMANLVVFVADYTSLALSTWRGPQRPVF